MGRLSFADAKCESNSNCHSRIYVLFNQSAFVYESPKSRRVRLRQSHRVRVSPDISYRKCCRLNEGASLPSMLLLYLMTLHKI